MRNGGAPTIAGCESLAIPSPPAPTPPLRYIYLDLPYRDITFACYDHIIFADKGEKFDFRKPFQDGKKGIPRRTPWFVRRQTCSSVALAMYVHDGPTRRKDNGRRRNKSTVRHIQTATYFVHQNQQQQYHQDRRAIQSIVSALNYDIDIVIPRHFPFRGDKSATFVVRHDCVRGGISLVRYYFNRQQCVFS
jgi:hypothetical protein